MVLQYQQMQLPDIKGVSYIVPVSSGIVLLEVRHFGRISRHLKFSNQIPLDSGKLDSWATAVQQEYQHGEAQFSYEGSSNTS